MWGAIKGMSWGARLLMLGLTAALFLAVFFIGYVKGKDISKVAIANYTQKIEKLRAEVAVKDTKIVEKVVTQYVDRLRFVDKVVYRNKNIIETVLVPQNHWSNGFVYSYNQSVLGLPIDPIQAADTTSSPVSDVAALSVINTNNGIAQATEAQLRGLQSFVKDTVANHPGDQP